MHEDGNFLQRMDKYVDLLVAQKGSDLHFSAGNLPAMRVDNKIIQMKGEKVIAQSDMEILIKKVLSAEKQEQLYREKQVDFSLEIKKGVRFRGNVFFQKGNLSMALRLISDKIKSLKELNIPESLYSFVEKKQGLFLVVGPNGNGKSTTLAALVEYLNINKQQHIITLEDPIEYVYFSKQSLIEQREISLDALNFKNSLKACFREDVDAILVGELRDLETISMAMTAAETGHLILGTLHTNDSVQTIDRIIDIFPPYQQNQIRCQLANVLLGVVSQRLVRRNSGGRIPAMEILIKNKAIENLIRQNQTHQIPTVLETSSEAGMISTDRYLAELVKSGEVDLEESRQYVADENVFEMLLNN